MISKELLINGSYYQYSRHFLLGQMECQHDKEICLDCPSRWDCVELACQNYSEAVKYEMPKMQ